jgi:hypothetical protein
VTDARDIATSRSRPRARTVALFGALFFSDIGGWVQMLVTTWLLLHGPRPALWLPLLMLARSLPKLAAAPFAGALADRVERLTLYRTSRWLAILPPVGLAAAGMGLAPRNPALLVIAAVGAVSAALDQPARRGLLWDVGGPSRVVGTVSLSNAAFHSAASLAPALAVLLVGTLGSYGALAVSAVIATRSAVCASINARAGGVACGQRAADDVHPLGGIQYLRRTPRALLLWVLCAAPGLAGRVLAIAIPAVAGSHASSSLAGTGALASAPGAGAFVAAVALSILGEISDKSRFALVTAIAFAAAMLLVPVSPSFAGAALLLAIAGGCSAAFGTAVVSMLHLQVPDSLRCRVMAL